MKESLKPVSTFSPGLIVAMIAMVVPDEEPSPSRKQEDPTPKPAEREGETEASPSRKQEDHEPDTYKPQRTVVNPDLG